MKPQIIIDELKSHGFDIVIYEHEAVFTVEEAAEIDKDIPGGNCKNMLLTNKKRSAYYLVILEAHKRMDFKSIGECIQVKHLKFARESTLARFDTFAGSVSPFVIREDHDGEIDVFMDEDLLDYERLNFHPNINNMTLGIKTSDFMIYMALKRHSVSLIDLK